MAHKRTKAKGMKGMLKVRRAGFHRKPYTRKSGVKVAGAYVPPAEFKIKDVGAVGRGKKVVKIRRKGALKELGYSTGASVQSRREALRKAINKFNAPTVFRMLQAQVVLRKRTQPQARNVFVADRNWVEEQMTRREKLGMTAKPREKWMAMSPRARALAMPERT